MYKNCSECQKQNMFSPGLSLEFSCIELVIQWTICRHIVGYIVDTKIRASDKDLLVQCWISSDNILWWPQIFHMMLKLQHFTKKMWLLPRLLLMKSSKQVHMDPLNKGKKMRFSVLFRNLDFILTEFIESIQSML